MTNKDAQDNLVNIWAENKDDGVVHCKYCRSNIDYTRKGFQALLYHSKTKKHAQNMSSVHDTNQLRLIRNQNVQLYVVGEDILIKELMWVLNIVQKNESIRSIEADSVLLKTFSDDLKSFSLGRTKASYLINEALGPNFQQMILYDMKDTHYALCYDETDSHNKTKELQIIAKYFSLKLKQLIHVHLQTFFMGRARSDDVVEKLIQAVNINKLISFKFISSIRK